MVSIGKNGVDLEATRKVLRETLFPAVRQMLPDHEILRACAEAGHRFRDRLFGPIPTVLHFLVQAIQRDESFAGTWQELWTPLAAGLGLSGVSSSSSALAQARSRLPREALESLARASLKHEEVPSVRWSGFRLLALDCSTVSMSREPELFAHFGAHRARTTTVRYPLATFASLLAVGTSTILDYRFGPFDPGEDRTAAPLLEGLLPDDLLLADRGFSGSPTLARLRARPVHFLMRKNARLIVERLPVVKRLGLNDFITLLPMSKPARKLDPGLPETVRIRIFLARVKTPAGEFIEEWFVTSLEDRRRFPPKKLAILYHRRWQIETSFLEFKVTFHADVLRSKTVDNIYKEFAAHLLAYQLVRRLMLKAAAKHARPATKISFLNAARWVVSFSARMSVMRTLELPRAYELLLDAIAGSSVQVRPGRLEPRALTREWKHYPHLRMTRAVWRRRRLLGRE